MYQVHPEHTRVFCHHNNFTYSTIGRLIHAAGDVEGHIGDDGKFYLLDLARSLPPENPNITKHLSNDPQGPFYRLLRPGQYCW